MIPTASATTDPTTDPTAEPTTEPTTEPTVPVEQHYQSDRVAAPSPSLTERVSLPLMWIAIGVVAAITTPAPPESVPVMQDVTAEILGWAGLAAIAGLVAAAIAGRSSIRAWSGALGAVGLVGLASCQMFGHPVFGSAWGLSQVAMVGAGLFVTGRLAVR